MDLINNLGSIAHSGSRDFKEQLQPDSGVALNGQYGMGFYSAFMVANKVQVISKHKDDDQYMWECAECSSYTICPYDKEQLGRGTKVILHIKDEEVDMLAPCMLCTIMDCFFEFIDYPIKIEDIGKEGTRTPLYWEYERMKPLWMYEPEEITQREYEDLFKWLAIDKSSSYLIVKHVNYKGSISFRALIFVPKVGPFDYCWNVSTSRNVRLLSRRVQIAKCYQDLLPKYLNFLYVIADSDNVLLNANRSDFHNPNEKQLISKVLTENVFEMLEEIADRPEIFNEFHKRFSKSIKLGVKIDQKNRHRLLPLMSYYTLKNGDRAIRLKDYADQMKPDQQQIYYLAGDDLKILSNSPLLESLKKSDLDVILMDSNIDQYIVDMIVSFANRKLVDVSATNFEMLTGLKQRENDGRISSEFESTCKVIKEILTDQVVGVIVSDKLIDTPCCISASTEGIPPNKERILKSQRHGDSSSAEKRKSKKYFEINSKDPIINRLREMFDQVDGPNASSRNIVNMLYSAALLRSGERLERPRSLTKLMYSFINTYLSLERKETTESMEELDLDIDFCHTNMLN